MYQMYTQEQMKYIIAILIEYCEKISAVNYCKAYKWMFGEETPVKVINGEQYTIGNATYLCPEREDIIIVVTQTNGKAGMVFVINGIYYKEGFLSRPQYLNYEECYDVDSFTALKDDLKFSSSVFIICFGKYKVYLSLIQQKMF